MPIVPLVTALVKDIQSFVIVEQNPFAIEMLHKLFIVIKYLFDSTKFYGINITS